IASYDDTYHLGRTTAEVAAQFFGAEAALDGNPAGGVVGPAEWTDIFYLVPAFRNYEWPAAAALFAGWVHNQDAAPLIDWYTGLDAPGYDNWYAANLAVRCTDAPWPTDWSTWQQDAEAIAPQAPFATWGNLWFDAPCLFWGAAPQAPVNVGANV